MKVGALGRAGRPVIPLLALLLAGSMVVTAQTPPPPGAAAPPPKFKDLAEVTRGMDKMPGYFTLYHSNETLYAEIKPNQFEQPVLAPITIARGMASAGQPLNFGDEWILVFRKVGDKIQLIRRNIHYLAPAGTPLEKAVKQNYTDSVLMALPIISLVEGTGALVDFSQIFLSDFAQVGLGMLDRNRSSYFKIKNFPNNTEIEVQATFTGGRMMMGMGSGDDGVADSRGITLVIHYSLAKLPEPGYKPRMADQRVGQFISASKDFGSIDPDTSFVRQINRWRLEKSDPKAKLSAPKKQLVWWVEDTVPHEYRPYVQDGILEWNKAFEKIGFRDAIGVRWQNERDDFDPEDINYCTFRWITTSSTFAMSGLRANPMTGEMIDGDVIFDASWIRAWKTEYAFLLGKPVPSAEGQAPLAVAEIISPIMAAKQGYGLPYPLPGIGARNQYYSWENAKELPELVPSQWNPLQVMLHRRQGPGHMNACNYVASKQYEMSLAAIALAEAGKAEPDAKLPEEFLGQAIKEVVMHEVGHSLGLRHNFHGSTMLKPEEFNDTSITRVKGLSGSIMDYLPLNIARKGQKQGDYATQTIGPYDYWAIEYTYKPIDGDEAVELKKIAARSPEPDLAYATDEDMYSDNDPYVNTYDLGAEPLKYGQDRIALAAELLKNLDENVVKDGESWARLRRAFSVILSQYGNGAYLAAGYIGGQSVSRDFKGGDKSRDPVTPVPGAKQREALNFLAAEILSDKAFEFSPRLLRRLTVEKWYHWGSETLSYGVDFDVYGRILAVQRIVLNQSLDSSVLTRILNQELQSEAEANPLRIAEVFDTLTKRIWSELSAESADGKPELSISTVRRNLQREYIRRLSSIVLGNRRTSFEDVYGYVVFLGSSGSVPADARDLARMHLENLSRQIGSVLRHAKLDDTSSAHLRECQRRIDKVLQATLTVNEP